MKILIKREHVKRLYYCEEGKQEELLEVEVFVVDNL